MALILKVCLGVHKEIKWNDHKEIEKNGMEWNEMCLRERNGKEMYVMKLSNLVWMF